MKSWDLLQFEVEPLRPRVISSSRSARAVAMELPAGEKLEDDVVREPAWLFVLDGEVAVRCGEERRSGSPGFLVELNPGRHEIVARSDLRLLLILGPSQGLGPRIVIDEDGYLDA